MKALILAAGRGTRIHSVHGDHPKCLIGCDNEKTILDHQIDALISAGIRQVGIVVGYEKDQIIRHVRRYHSQHAVQFIENPHFAKTNNIYSFWLAEKWLNRDAFVCLNADVVFDRRILAPAVDSPSDITMIVDPEWRDETMKVIIREDRVVRMSKQIPRSDFSGTYIGITSFAAGVQEKLFEKVNGLIRAGKENEFFNVAVQQLADEGGQVGFTPTYGLPWAEIDDPGDLAFARAYVFPRLKSARIAA